MKIKQLQKILLEKDIDFALFLNTDEGKRDKNIFYFTGIDVEFCCLIVPKKKEPFLIVSKLEEEIVRKESKVKKIRIYEKDLFKQIKTITKKSKKIGVDFSKFSLLEKKSLKKEFKKAILVDIGNEMRKLRIEKTKEEIENIKKACKITDDIFLKIIKNIKKFRYESEIEELILKEAEKNNCELSFPPIVASGKNSSMPHYKNNNSKLSKGFCVMDFGVKYKGYCSDMTRTIYIGTPDIKEIEDYYKLLGVQEEAIKKIKENTDFKKLDEATRKVLGPEFIHGLGHGLGIEVHDPLQTTKSKKLILKENTVLTIEPGIYHPKRYGIRIEDDILVTKKGCEVLTKSKKELIIINN